MSEIQGQSTRNKGDDHMKQPVRGLFAGSFDPYTLGHHAVVTKASRLFDEVYVLIGVNTAKKRSFPDQDMQKAIERALEQDGLSNCKVVIYDGMVADYCSENGINFLIRGLRNSMDYDYEENIAQVNKLLNPELESIYIRADDAAVSSSMVRELLAFSKDVSPYVPESVLRLVEK
jgi:pantetheine-phosphate adenylyltransferase